MSDEVLEPEDDEVPGDDVPENPAEHDEADVEE